MLIVVKSEITWDFVRLSKEFFLCVCVCLHAIVEHASFGADGPRSIIGQVADSGQVV